MMRGSMNVNQGKTSVRIDQCYYQHIVTAYDVQLAVLKIIIMAIFRTARRCLANRNQSRAAEPKSL